MTYLCMTRRFGRKSGDVQEFVESLRSMYDDNRTWIKSAREE